MRGEHTRRRCAHFYFHTQHTNGFFLYFLISLRRWRRCFFSGVQQHSTLTFGIESTTTTLPLIWNSNISMQIRYVPPELWHLLNYVFEMKKVFFSPLSTPALPPPCFTLSLSLPPSITHSLSLSLSHFRSACPSYTVHIEIYMYNIYISFGAKGLMICKEYSIYNTQGEC